MADGSGARGIVAGRRLAAAALLAASATAAAPVAAAAGDHLFRATHILDIGQGSSRSDAARAAARGGFELSDGRRVGFSDWYSTGWRDFHLSFLTRISDNAGIVWGFSTGERGEKYSISPGIRLGLVAALHRGPRSTLTLSLTAQLGSDLRERACIADYGALGVARVNCRLAATALAPKDTLRRRMRMDGIDDSRIALAYELRF